VEYSDVIIQGDALEKIRELPDDIVDCVVTSPPYYKLRDYDIDGQIGDECSVFEYIDKLVDIFKEVRRILKPQGTLWLNLGDTYAYSGGIGSPKLESKNWKQNAKPHIEKGFKPKDLIGVPWRVAFALQEDGWYLRGDIIWNKPNSMPESVKDRPTNSHEYIFLMAKNKQYYYDADAIMEIATGYDGRKDTYFNGGKKYNEFNNQTMLSRGHQRWKFVSNKMLPKNLQYNGQRPNTMHIDRMNGIEKIYVVRNKRLVWSINTYPFMGSGTVAVVAKKLGRKYLGIELNPKYIEIANKRLAQKMMEI